MSSDKFVRNLLSGMIKYRASQLWDKFAGRGYRRLSTPLKLLQAIFENFNYCENIYPAISKA